jgi:hypothetical protein
VGPEREAVDETQTTTFWTVRMPAIIIVMIETYLLFYLSSPQISIHSRLLRPLTSVNIDFAVALQT